MSSSSKSLTKDLKNIDIPNSIKELANELYIKFRDTSPKKVYRRGPRNAIKFAFIFKAYYSLKIPVDPKQIIQRLNITDSYTSVIKQGISLAFDDNDGILQDQYFTVKDMTPGMLIVLDYPADWIGDIEILYTSLECFRYDISLNKPQDIAAGIIFFYAKYVKKFKVDADDIACKLYTSKSLINSIYKALVNILKDE